MSAQYQPYDLYETDRKSDIIVMCDHATNFVPPEINGGTLGISDRDMNRHIAYDVGAKPVARMLADLMQAPAIFSNFSRLVIDPNRGDEDPTLVMQLYDGSIIPANRNIPEAEIERRKSAYYQPYHDAVSSLIAEQADPVLLSIHSFTPRLNGRGLRPWQVGVLYAEDDRLAKPVLEELRRDSALDIGDNKPYTGRLPGDTMDRHAIKNGLLHVLIELRSDLIEGPEGQRLWAEKLAPVLTKAIKTARKDMPNG